MAKMIDSCKAFWSGEESEEQPVHGDSNLASKRSSTLFKPWQKKTNELTELLNILNSSDGRVPNPFRVGEKWQEIQGSRDWEGLLEPLDLSLRAEIIRYGKLAQATYAAFDKIPIPNAVAASSTRKSSSRSWGLISMVTKALHSKHRGCHFKGEELLKEVGLENQGYNVHQFLYATAKLSFLRIPFSKKCRKDSNWIGFVAVCTSQQEIERLGRRDIVVAWRGTITNLEWVKDAECWLENFGIRPQNSDTSVKVEHGFHSIYNGYPSNEKRNNNKSARDQVIEAVKDLVEKYKDEEIKLSISITGHSLGSALATLCAFDIAGELESLLHASPSGQIPITVYSFAGPRVGNRAFKRKIEERGVKVLRVVNKNDIVTKIPGRIRGTIIFRSYKHVGVKLDISNLDRINDVVAAYELPVDRTEGRTDATTTDITDLGDNTGNDSLQPCSQPQTPSPPSLSIPTSDVQRNTSNSVTKYFNIFEYVRKVHSLVGYLDILEIKPGVLDDLIKGLLGKTMTATAYLAVIFCTKLRGAVVRKNFSRQKKMKKPRRGSATSFDNSSPVLTPKASPMASCASTSSSLPLAHNITQKRNRKLTEGQESNLTLGSFGEISPLRNTELLNEWEEHPVLNTEPARGNEQCCSETVWKKKNEGERKKRQRRGAGTKKAHPSSTKRPFYDRTVCYSSD